MNSIMSVMGGCHFLEEFLLLALTGDMLFEVVKRRVLLLVAWTGGAGVSLRFYLLLGLTV